jgi:hypothetical protein
MYSRESWKRVGWGAGAVFITSTTANSVYWMTLYPVLDRHPAGFPFGWWVLLFTAPFAVVAALGWTSTSGEAAGVSILAIFIGLLLQALATAALHLPGHGRAPVVPPGENAVAGVMIGTVLWTGVMTLGLFARWSARALRRQGARVPG